MTKRTNITFAVLTLLITGLLSLGCEKDEGPEFFLNCNIGGIAWKANRSLTCEENQGNIIINGISDAGDTLRLLIADNEPGKWPIKSHQNICVLKRGGVTYLPLNSADAELNVKIHDKENKLIEGSFFYTADSGEGNWLLVTAGEFKCTYCISNE